MKAGRVRACMLLIVIYDSNNRKRTELILCISEITFLLLSLSFLVSHTILSRVSQ
jgi:hypothetical protein